MLHVQADFNGDGFADLAAGAPQDSVSGHDRAGAVNVLYGSVTGLGTRGNQQFTQDTPGMHEDLPGAATTGAVNVVFGSETGFRDELWFQNRRGVPARSEQGDRFGLAVAAGDLSGNRAMDLAVGVPAESVVGRDWAGAVDVFYGGRGGLRTDAAQLWHQNRRGVKGTAEAFDRFGGSLLNGISGWRKTDGSA